MHVAQLFLILENASWLAAPRWWVAQFGPRGPDHPHAGLVKQLLICKSALGQVLTRVRL